jgi:hypothetical protein
MTYMRMYKSSGSPGSAMPPRTLNSTPKARIPISIVRDYNAAMYNLQAMKNDPDAMSKTYKELLNNIHYTYNMTKDDRLINDYWDFLEYINKSRME